MFTNEIIQLLNEMANGKCSEDACGSCLLSKIPEVDSCDDFIMKKAAETLFVQQVMGDKAFALISALLKVLEEKGVCSECAHYSPHHMQGACSKCIHDKAQHPSQRNDRSSQWVWKNIDLYYEVKGLVQGLNFHPETEAVDLPCQIGNIIYEVLDAPGHKILPIKVGEITLNEDGWSIQGFALSDFGKKVFTTYEEAWCRQQSVRGENTP